MVKRVQQTITKDSHPGVPGNCLQAAVASLLELPLEAVPHFVLFDDWFNALSTWIQDKGFRLAKVHAPVDYPVLAFGMSPRGVAHAVVWSGGSMMADPHPDQSGLAEPPYEYWSIA